jgi:L-alanine-DL-glutamate epimerase-like enolase superfamily enzyme
MRVKRVEVWNEVLPLRQSYTVAYGTFSQVENIFVRLHTDGPAVGYGCAAPETAVTGETTHAALTALHDAAGDALKGADVLQRARVLEPLRQHLLPLAPAALAAVDMALLDLLGKAAQLPVCQLLGGYRDGMRSSVTIGIVDEETAEARARACVERGFRCLKLKGGRDVQADIARVWRVRQAVGRGIELRFDANGGYTLDQCHCFLTATRAADIAVLEQPTPADQPELLAQVTRGSPLPVMADESLTGLEDALRLAGSGSVDMINVKLMKAGGIGEAQQIAAVARAAKLPVMVGCMDESALGIAAALHFALACPQVTLADLDGHLALEHDPFAGAVTLRDGSLYPSCRPGLGCPEHRARACG